MIHAGIMGHALEPEVIYEDDDILAVNKPAGLLVHGISNKAGRNKEPTLADWLIARHPEIKNVGDDPALRPGIVHRLDRDTSGVMLVAKNQKAFEHLKSLFMSRAMQKEYIAVVWGKFKEREGVIDAPLGIVVGSTKRSTRSAKMAKSAVTHYRVIRAVERGGDDYTVLLVIPQTGRTHQIRVHLASIGHPIVGDTLYGRRKKSAWASRLMLHAMSVQFTTLAGTAIRIEAPLPEEFNMAGL